MLRNYFVEACGLPSHRERLKKVVLQKSVERTRRCSMSGVSVSEHRPNQNWKDVEMVYGDECPRSSDIDELQRKVSDLDFSIDSGDREVQRDVDELRRDVERLKDRVERLIAIVDELRPD